MRIRSQLQLRQRPACELMNTGNLLSSLRGELHQLRGEDVSLCFSAWEMESESEDLSRPFVHRLMLGGRPDHRVARRVRDDQYTIPVHRQPENESTVSFCSGFLTETAGPRAACCCCSHRRDRRLAISWRALRTRCLVVLHAFCSWRQWWINLKSHQKFR